MNLSAIEIELIEAVKYLADSIRDVGTAIFAGLTISALIRGFLNK